VEMSVFITVVPQFVTDNILFSVSMENILTDYKDLEKGMQLTQKEYEARKNSRDAPSILKDFLLSSEDRLKKLQADIKTAEVSSFIVCQTKILKIEGVII
jgi:hypothetical protein